MLTSTQLYLDYLEWKANSHAAYMGADTSYSRWLEMWWRSYRGM